MGSPGSGRTTQWDLARYIDPDRHSEGDDKPFALLILNQEITDLALFSTLWDNSSFHVCADGGANRLYNALQTDQARKLMLPNAIIGDLDSLRSHVHTFYASLNVPVIKDPDQDSTDFGKCLEYISRHTGLQSPPESAGSHNAPDSWRGVKAVTTHSPITVVAVGGFGGRVDQSLYSLHALHTTATTHRLLLISSENITFLLPPGRNIIKTPHHILGKTCGILPIGCPSIITTHGLEWDLKDAETRFGGLISTSNHLASEEVEVETSEAVVFTVEIRKRGV